jgi:hypothetical protein
LADCYRIWNNYAKSERIKLYYNLKKVKKKKKKLHSIHSYTVLRKYQAFPSLLELKVTEVIPNNTNIYIYLKKIIITCKNSNYKKNQILMKIALKIHKYVELFPGNVKFKKK